MAGTFAGFEPYRLTGVQVADEEYGRGSYAVVVGVEYRGLKCAGKKLHIVLIEEGVREIVYRFEGECRLLAQMRHPNIVQFIGVYFEEDSAIPILVMEFLPTTLARCIDTYGILPEEVSYSILHDVALGLYHLHSQAPPIVHRDLSANNVLLTPNMTAKISDLGVAKILNLTPLQLSRMTRAPGTLAYMPPEALSEEPRYDTRIDEFSYGVLMIHVLCGQWPFPCEPVRVNPENQQLIPVSEAERRNQYLRIIGNAHPQMDLILRCVSNIPEQRARAAEIVQRMDHMTRQFPPTFANRVTMLIQIGADETEKEQLRNEKNATQALLHIGGQQRRRLAMYLEQSRQENEATQAQLREEIQRLEMVSQHAATELEQSRLEAEIEAQRHVTQVEQLCTENTATQAQLREEIQWLQEMAQRRQEEIERSELAHSIEIEQLHLRLAELQTQSEAHQTELKATIETHQAEMRAQNEAREQERKTLRNRQDVLAEETARMRCEIEELHSAIVSKNREIESKQHEIHTKTQELSAKDDTIAAKSVDISTKEAAIVTKDATLIQKASELASKNAILERRSSVIERLNKQLTSTRGFLARQIPQDIAEESWHKYLLWSVIVKVFQGQLKSTFVCPDCHKVSKMFDPFMFLSLPLSIKKTSKMKMNTRKIFVALVRADPTADVYKFQVQVPKKGCVMDVKNELRKLTDISTDRMVLVDVYNSRFHRIYTNQESLSHILDRDDIYMYELSHPLGHPDWVHMLVYQREQIVREVRYTYNYQSYSQCYHQLFGLPMVVRIPRQHCTYRMLYNAISQQCCRFIKPWSDIKEKADEESMSGVMDLFQLVVVNSYGSQDVQKLKDNSDVLRLSTQTYIACDWSTEVKDKYYDVEAAEEVKLAEGRENVELMDCLNLFLAEKTLSKDDAWYCPECKKSVQALKKFDLLKLPEILVIHLKRYTYERSGWDKLDVNVKFPMSGLDLTGYVKNPDDPEPVYDLFAVLHHSGDMGGSHYIAYCKKKETGKWHNFDDSHFSEVSEDQVMNAAAYLLFNRRQMEGHAVPHVQDCSLSQSIADEVRQKRPHYQPEGSSHSEVGRGEVGEGQQEEETLP